MCCAFCPENRPKPSYSPKSLWHSPFLRGGFRAIRPNPPIDLSGPPGNPPNITFCNHAIWSGWAGRAGLLAKLPEFVKCLPEMPRAHCRFRQTDLIAFWRADH